MVLYDITINTENNDNSSDSDVATSTDAINYERLSETIYQSTYSALSDYYSDNPLPSNNYTINNSGSLPLEFATDTDATLYTVTLESAPTTCEEQVGAYVLDMRNILLIFLFVYLIITIYSKLKSSFNNFFWRS